MIPKTASVLRDPYESMVNEFYQGRAQLVQQQLDETRDFELLLAHIANTMLEQQPAMMAEGLGK